MDGYINELYKTNEGKLLGYKVLEEKTIAGYTSQYYTLWFNLNSISGINNVKLLDKTNNNQSTLSTNDVYLNNSTSLFKPTYNKKFTVKTSRKYDIEYRTQYLYGLDEESNLVEYEVKVPMMFIQDDHDTYTNYSDFSKDIKSDNGITASVNLASTYLTKIRNDFNTLIPQFKNNKDTINSNYIKTFID